MQNLDPTYLRYIYDGLIKGSVHSENESELPDGLIGLYEEAFEENFPLMYRQKLLQRFTLFALLKKEVSISFVALVLEESEQEILEFINAYASWFNSPEPGKFQLYHERLKVYFLNKNSDLSIINLNEILINFLKKSSTSELEVFRYKLEYLFSHIVFGAHFKEHNRQYLFDFLYDSDFITNLVIFRVNLELFFEGISRAIELSMKNNDWELLETISISVSKFHTCLTSQKEKDLKSAETDWRILFDHFDSAPDTEEKIRLFFIMLVENRQWSSDYFDTITDRVKQFSEDEYIDLSEIAPVWLINKVKSLFSQNINLNAFFDEADHNEIIQFNDLEANFSYATEEFNEYPKEYKSDFKRILNILSSKDEINKDIFQELYSSITSSNLISKDEIACRITIELILNKLNSTNTLSWFFWLLTDSSFELGEHSWGRVNTYELCLLLIKKGGLFHLELLVKKIDEIEMDYHTKIKLRNILSDAFFNYSEIKLSKEIIISFGKSKGERLDTLSWIKSWILNDLKNRVKAKSLTNLLDQLEISFHEFKSKQIQDLNEFQKSEFYLNLNKLDNVSRAEYLAEFSVQIDNFELKRFMITTAWNLVCKADDWALLFAQISVFSAALETMPKEWNQEAFKSLKKNFSKYDLDDYETHLSETLFKTTKFRFASNPPFQNLKRNYHKEFKWLISEFPSLLDVAKNEILFNEFLENKLNNYFSIKEMWIDAKKFFRSGKPGEYFTEFWNYINNDTKLFVRFTLEDLRVINIISRKINVRFPFECFTSHHSKIQTYCKRFIIPDPYHLGIIDGFESMARFSNEIDFDQDFRIVFSAAMRGSSKRYVNRDWTMDPIQPIAYALRKLLHYPEDISKVSALLSLRSKLISFN